MINEGYFHRSTVLSMRKFITNTDVTDTVQTLYLYFMLLNRYVLGAWSEALKMELRLQRKNMFVMRNILSRIFKTKLELITVQ